MLVTPYTRVGEVAYSKALVVLVLTSFLSDGGVDRISGGRG